ncbi:granulin a isoform X4 [Acanthochromis polyacanthus]|uniref:granulin a isoform X4 n=1 Tax=Acanthochromis polyacanthus TaxID=80966 RepID=UPI00223476E3|nr:granulin a isoform X4 [Acanthochromis polyacanthus]
MFRWVVISWALLALVGADECPDGGRCEDGQTCCNDPASGYECCPFDQAECCEDHIHCCPADTVCETATSSCVNATVTIPWVERASADQPRLSKSFRMIKSYMGDDDDNICPDLSQCPAEFSCLKALTRFGCCPLAQGVSCSDGKHCCPEGHQCSADSRSCIKKDIVTTVICKDGVSECPDETTCCETPEGTWACCPIPNAVCCSDKIHCCPDGTTCDVEHSKCNSLSTDKVLPMWAKLPARMRADWENLKVVEQVTAGTVNDVGAEKVLEVTTANGVPPSEEEVSTSSVTKAAAGNDVPCNQTAACPDGTTCCKTKEGEWACCPLPEAVCCEDFVHCCPKGKKCNLEAQTCDDGFSSVPWAKKVPSIPRSDIQVKDVPCDDTVGCPDGSTCCKTKEGGWACCPLPEAVCCEDFVHCCPKGKKCNLEAQTCDDGFSSVPWAKKVPSIPRSDVQVKDIPCDDTVGCPDGTTCCKTKEGGWACCPLPEAVCCEDFVHCCPKGKKCNLEAQTCDDGFNSVPWAKKVPSIPRSDVQVKDIPCDDTVGCPDGTTCCKTKEGGWACCPLPEAVCCEDFEHCCPKGKKCNLTAQTCDDGTRSVPWTEKVPSIPQQIVQVKVVPCDDTASCPDGSTCCKTKEGKWACCPLPEAVCCDDHEHCCPAGTTCDSTSLSCQGPSASVPMKQKVPAFSTAAPTTASQAQVTEQEDEKEEPVEENKEIEGKIQCDPRTSCPQSSTCCFVVASRQWGCCPLPQAVCCADGSHCCPQNYKCNEQATSCVKGEVEIPWYTKLPALTSDQSDLSAVQCDGGTQCPEHTTCCKLATGEWGCCPLENAVCCSDKKHCCPQDFICNEASNSCQRLITLEVEMVPLTPVYLPDQPLPSPLTHGDIPCDEKTRCKDGQTCCRTSTTTWGCCPSPNAVCCSDMRHCCPNGSSCTEEGSCIEDPFLYWSNWHVFLANKKRGLLL